MYDQDTQIGLGVLVVLVLIQILLATLRLTNTITISWWLVLIPLYLIIVYFIAGIILLIKDGG